MLTFLQQIGRALMTPIAVLPVAAILLRLGMGDIPFIDGITATIMKSAGEAIFSNLDLLFAIGIAYGLAKHNDGAAALSATIGVLIAKAVYSTIDAHLNMGVFIGIIIGVSAGLLYNRYHTIKLPDAIGFFGGKRFVPILTAIVAIAIGVVSGYLWHYAQSAIDAFSQAIISLEEIGTFLYGILNRLLIPLGLHHILNSVFWFQLGEFTYLKEGVEQVAHGDLHRFFAGDKSAGVYMSGFYVVMMFGLPAMALALYLHTPKEKRTYAAAILGGTAFTSFLTGVTEPLEFLFIFTAPLLFLAHAILTGLALATAQLLNIHSGFGFSAGLIDYLINYKLSTNPLYIIPLGLLFALLYFIVTTLILRWTKVNLFQDKKQESTQTTITQETEAFITALGGKENIVSTDACITRLRIKVVCSETLKDEPFLALGAKGVVRPDNKSIQVVLGTKAEGVAEKIRELLK
jgi:PTS system N-acetylglucosamine-specific IIC component